MQKVGPLTRRTRNAAQDKKELDAFFKQWIAAWEKGNLTTASDMVDFPVMMMTDDSKGNFKMDQMSREQWTAMMKPFADPKAMKDMKMTSKSTCHLLSDDLASCEGENAMQMGKMTRKFNSHSIMIRKDGKWKIKSMMEAGWGDMPAPKS